MNNLPRKKFTDVNNNIREDLKLFIHNVVYNNNISYQEAFEMTYPDLKLTPYRGSRLWWFMMKNHTIREYYERLLMEKNLGENLLCEVASNLKELKSEKKWNEYNTLLKIYINLLKDHKPKVGKNTIDIDFDDV